MIGPEACVDSLRLTFDEVRQILDQLDWASRNQRFIELRRDARYRYAVNDGIRVQLDDQSGGFIVRPRNISAGGLSFLHGSFLYPGAHCRIALRALDGDQVEVGARLARCRCVRGRIHEVAAVFDERIDIERFVNTDQVQPIKPAPVSLPQTSSAELDLPAPENQVEQLLRVVDGLRLLIQSGAPRGQVAKVLRKLTELLVDADLPQ